MFVCVREAPGRQGIDYSAPEPLLTQVRVSVQDKIEAILDEALLTDKEMVEYERNAKEQPDRVVMDWTTSPPIPVDIPALDLKA